MVILTRRDGAETPIYLNVRNVLAVEPDEFDTAVVYTAEGAWRVLERFEWVTWELTGSHFEKPPERFSQDDPYPEATGPEAVRPRFAIGHPGPLSAEETRP